MKIAILLFTLTLLSAGITSSKKSNYYQTECVSLETDGYVTIRIWNTKKGLKYKLEQARKDAIHSILFIGIAGGNGCSTQPPLLTSMDDQSSFEKVEKSFFSSKGNWSRFTRNGTENSFGTNNDISPTRNGFMS